MFSFLKDQPLSDSEAKKLFHALSKEKDIRNYPFKLKSFSSGKKISNAAPEIQRQVALLLIKWLKKRRPAQYQDQNWQRYWSMHNTVSALLNRKLPFTEEDVHIILNWIIAQNKVYVQDIPQAIKVLANYLKERTFTKELRQEIKILIKAVQKRNQNTQQLRWVIMLRELLGETEIHFPLVEGDIWANVALAYINEFEPEQQSNWSELFMSCLRISGSKPSKKWMKEMDTHIAAIGVDEYRSALLNWMPLVSTPRPEPASHFSYQRNNPNLVWYLDISNNDILKGLVWTLSKEKDPGVARALSALAITTYKKIPGVGARAAKIGNACFWVLGQMLGMEGIAQLSILKLRIKGRNAQKGIARALDSASKRVGISAEEIEELSVPSYDMEEVGVYREKFEGYQYELRIQSSELKQVWVRDDARQLKSVPKAVREKNPDELRAIKAKVKDIRKMLPAQRNRIDNLYLTQKVWGYGVWHERYIEHPLVGSIGRRLIWKFSKGDRAASGIWLDGQFVENDGHPLDWLDEKTSVELWHPIMVETDVVLAWRGWLNEHEVQQPFKQAHREVYLLTEAEINTHTYSNRYAAHILRQHQFNALCAARGWKNSLRLMVDDYFPPAAKTLPQWNLRAEYWIEGIGDEYGTDTNDTGTYFYLTTDQVRFYNIDARENAAHAGGGGYGRRAGNLSDPLPMDQIPSLVFSEIMRDVDMFVGVASLGNDPNWLDGGRDARYNNYWHSYSFGELTETAKTRKQVLEWVLPRLKIAEYCELDGKFLKVRGEIRTYKIHLGSGNILMEPNDQYLCIVPAGRTAQKGKDKVFLPFEGDKTLAIILSKAFMLAEDKKITDTTITRQLKR
ncbi:MAG: DUF4132 domain-containing protein [Chloroflexi bacterium]|nr:DUF4132 domain-containing protein [Chloroflexota bacterium]